MQFILDYFYYLRLVDNSRRYMHQLKGGNHKLKDKTQKTVKASKQLTQKEKKLV